MTAPSGERVPVGKTTLVHLTDAELALLDGHASPKVQTVVAAALARLSAAQEHADLPPRHAGLIADVLTEARQRGEVVMYCRRCRHCPLCGRHAGYARFKSGYRKGENDHKRPLSFDGWEFAYRFVTVDMHISVGGCRECVDPLLDRLAEALRGVPAQVPDRLRAEGEPKRTRCQRAHCTVCDWRGHEGQMGRSRTLMGDGTYPSTCPNCGAENKPLGRHLIERGDGWVVTDEDGVACGQSPDELTHSGGPVVRSESTESNSTTGDSDGS